MKALPSGIHTFERIINENKLYVDKTEYIYNLITTGSAYFLSRPRRFGKSLLISTLQALFEGNRDLFANLWLGQQTDYAFESYPVLQIDMSKVQVQNREQLETYLLFQIDQWAEQFQIDLTYPRYDGRLGELLKRLGQDKPVVILIDEYDKPLLDNLTKASRDEIKETLKGFYTAIKAADPYLRFVLLTGVTKFSRISVFSGLNNLVDLTMSQRYATILGFTQAELETYFAPYITQLSPKLGLNQADLLAKIQYWYNGYRFSSKEGYVYNPFSTLLLFEQEEFKFHWFETGTPTFLLDLIKNRPSSWRHIPEQKLVSEKAFSTYEVERLEALPLLFQTGYLTIKGIDHKLQIPLYLLDYPNFEVKQAFLAEVLIHFTDIGEESTYIYRLVTLFEAGDIEGVLAQLTIFFANIDYSLEIKNEKYYQTIFFVVFELLGFNIKTEVQTNRGRIDAVVEMPEAIYLFEFKLFESAESALKQIKGQAYYQKYLKQPKPVVLVGVAFNQAERNIGEWLIETVHP